MPNFEDPSLVAAIKAASTDGTSTPDQVSNRMAVLQEVFFDSNPGWFQPFAIMLLIASGIATLGLSQNSPATVIGAMIIAPLGSPIVSLGGAIVLGWPRQIWRMLVFIALGAVSVIAVGFVIGLFLPTGTPTDQILARTDPDLRDLGVALLAGAAGAFARHRKELSSTLAGVAIAVALVPPLCAAGLLLEDGRPVLAQGALLLFFANLVGIAFAVSVVMILTGYAPRPHFPRSRLGQALAIIIVIGTIVVMVPLSRSYALLSGKAVRLATVNRIVSGALGPRDDAILKDVYLSGNVVEVNIVTRGTPIDVNDLTQKLTNTLGAETHVTINTE